MLIGVVGGGQLGRMLALAGQPLGIGFRFLDPTPNAPAGQVAEQIVAAYDDPDGLKALAHDADVVTSEFENVPVEAARSLEAFAPVFPSPVALEASQDRLAEKGLFRRLGIPVHPFAPVASENELRDALDDVGTPAILKTRRLGYDGRGQVVIRSQQEAGDAWRSVGAVPALLEQHVDFDRELSIIAARGRQGQTIFYPMPENHHREGILRLSVAPAPGLEPELQESAERFASAVLDDLGYVGVLAIELFQVGERLLANEMAPRVHNSGHWTIEGAETSQFEDHVRAIADLPLGSPAMRGVAAMLNIVGTKPDPADVLAVPGAHLHLYGKAERPRRKLGHVTVRADDAETLRRRVEVLEPIVG